MTPLGALLVLLGASLAAALGPRLLSEKRGVRVGVAIGALLGILVKVVLVVFTSLEPLLDGIEPFVWFERQLAVPFGVLFFAVAAGLIENPRSARAVKVMPFLLVAYLLAAEAWALTTPECYTKSDGIWNKGVCIQSTDFTCGPAAIATLLRKEGIKDATEHEAARLAWTIPGRGSTDLGAALALRKKLPERPVKIRTVPIDRLEDVPVPALLPLRYCFWFDHMTVLLGVEKDRFEIADPLQGPVLLSRSDLEGRYLGRVITVR